MQNANKTVTNSTLKKIWAQVPVDYYDHVGFFQNLWHQEKIRVFTRLLQDLKPKTILEVGCANGHLTKQLALLFPAATITAIDVYKPVIDFARNRYKTNKNLHFLVADAHKLPFKPNSFDLVICSETIEHVIEPGKVIDEMVRVAKPNETILIEMDSGSILFRWIWFFFTHFMKGRVWKDAHLHPFTAQELGQLIQSNHVTIQQTVHSHIGMAVTYIASKRV